TGGTITGVGRYLKSKNPHVEIVAVEPADSAVLSGGQKGPHGLQGIGAGFVPDILDTKIYDRVITVTTDQAYEASRLLAKKEGVLAGISSGAALHAALSLAADPAYEGKNVVVLLTDTGERYLSGELFK
ncbi:MAG: pyridoxal-phosphate dependent enzyme, partial [Clostridia bacterium]|nr:pyridoxal-phosphate dependent enzyme [Clostridia bacterium]